VNIAYYDVHVVNVNGVHIVNIVGQSDSREAVVAAVNSGTNALIADATAFGVGSDHWEISWRTPAVRAFCLQKLQVQWWAL